jgi:ureidoglycolate dehydrogenase (NAD+)
VARVSTSAHRVDADELCAFAVALLVAHGADREESDAIARILIWCDRVGRRTYGVWRLPIICAKLDAGAISSPCTPELTQLAPAVVRVDANGGAGQYVAELAAVKAVALARDSGVGLVTVRGAHHFGASSYYAHLATTERMVGIVATNAAPKVAAWGGALPVLGTNALAFGAPLGDGRSVLVDLATSASAAATLRWAAERGQVEIPPGIAIDAAGHPLRDARLLKEGALLPFGGAKGYALGLMVEILAGVLGGGGVSRDVVTSFGESSNAGQVFVAIDIERFLPIEEFDRRLGGLVESIRSSGLGDALVQVPGDARWEAFDESASGIPLDAETVTALDGLARGRGVDPPWS